MRALPKRGCSVPRCPHFVPCPLHHRRHWRGVSPDPTERGYGNEWQLVRRIILARDGHACHFVIRTVKGGSPLPIVCGAYATHVDHRIPKSRGGSDDPSNLISLCVRHHRAKTGREGKASQG